MPPVDGLTPRQAEIREKLLDRSVRGPARAALLGEFATETGAPAGGAAERRDIRSAKSIELNEKLLGLKPADPARRALVDELHASLAVDQSAADQAAAKAGAGERAS